MLDCWSDSKFQGFTKAENEFSDRTETQSFQWNRYWQSFRTEVLVWSSQSSDWGLLCVMTWWKNWPQILDQLAEEVMWLVQFICLLEGLLGKLWMDLHEKFYWTIWSDFQKSLWGFLTAMRWSRIIHMVPSFHKHIPSYFSLRSQTNPDPDICLLGSSMTFFQYF